MGLGSRGLFHVAHMHVRSSRFHRAPTSTLLAEVCRTLGQDELVSGGCSRRLQQDSRE